MSLPSPAFPAQRPGNSLQVCAPNTYRRIKYRTQANGDSPPQADEVMIRNGFGLLAPANGFSYPPCPRMVASPSSAN